MKCYIDIENLLEKDVYGLLEQYETVYLSFLNQSSEGNFGEGFLIEVCRTKEAAIMERKDIDNILYTYLVKIEEEFAKKYPRAEQNAERFREHKQLEPMSELISWPSRAVKKAKEILAQGNNIKISRFGINHLVYLFLKERDKNGDIELELSKRAEAAHLAAALDAVYIPSMKNDIVYSEAFVAGLMMEVLRVYINGYGENVFSQSDYTPVSQAIAMMLEVAGRLDS